MSILSIHQLIRRLKIGLRNPLARNPKAKTYHYKLDGYYYCKKEQKIMLILCVRYKRIADPFSLEEVITDRELIRKLHPVDACILGVLANCERNGALGSDCDGWQEMKRFRQACYVVKSVPLLKIIRKDFDSEHIEITILKSPCLDKEINIPTLELSKNEALLYALDSFQAMSVGYGANEASIRQEEEKHIRC